MRARMTDGGRRQRIWRGVAAAALAGPGLIALETGLGILPVPVAHGEGIHNVKPGDYYTEFDMPECGSKNIEDGIANFRNTIGSGSTIFVGQEIEVKVALYNGIMQPADGNDGPDPLTLVAQPSGPLQQTAPTKAGVWDVDGTTISFGGDGFVGPIEPVGLWGYKFDANSSPKVVPVASADGTDEQITIKFKATAPGIITLPGLKVTGYDGTPIGGNVNCTILVNWFWQVIEMEGPQANIDFVYLDARYPKVQPGDATTGRHGVSVDVLANDADPNLLNGPNDHNVKLVSWSSNLDCGDPSLNGVTPTAANFDSLSEESCRYFPEVGQEFDSASYTMVQRSGLIQKSTDVIINFEYNSPPQVADAEEDVLTFGAFSGSFLDYADDFESDPIVCTPQDTATFDVAANCDFDYTAPGAPGDYTRDVEICDTHETLSTGQMGDAVRIIDYDKDTPGSDHDLDETHSRRCSIGTITFHVKANAPDLLPPFNLKNIVDKVDTEYPDLDPVIGPFNLKIDTLEAEAGPLTGGTPTALSLVTTPLPFQGEAEAQNQFITFSPAPNWVGPVTFTFRMCADFGNPVQNVCKTAKVLITVVGNLAPKPKPDDFGPLLKGPYVRSVVANDAEPQLEALLCKTNLVSVNPPEAFTSVELAANCQLSFQGAPGYVGPASVEYRVCDNHHLVIPTWPDPAGYGPFFQIPGGNAPRCSNSTASMTFSDPPPLVEDPPAGPNNLPMCNADAFETVQNVAFVGDVLANDTDLDESNVASPLTLLEADDPATQQGGSIAPEAGKLRYTPPADFVGIDTAVYDAADTDAHGCNATVTYTVKADTDGDGVPNDIDPDIDGDGLPNDQDPDMDGDGLPNDSDPDMDGDGVPNDEDADDNSDGQVDAPPPPPTMPGPPTELPSTGTGEPTARAAAIGSALLLCGFLLIAATRRERRRPRGGEAVRR